MAELPRPAQTVPEDRPRVSRRVVLGGLCAVIGVAGAWIETTFFRAWRTLADAEGNDDLAWALRLVRGPDSELVDHAGDFASVVLRHAAEPRLQPGIERLVQLGLSSDDPRADQSLSSAIDALRGLGQDHRIDALWKAIARRPDRQQSQADLRRWAARAGHRLEEPR